MSTDFTPTAGVTPPVPAIAAVASQVATSDGSGLGKKILIGVIVCVIICAVIVIVYLTVKNGSSSSTPSTGTPTYAPNTPVPVPAPSPTPTPTPVPSPSTPVPTPTPSPSPAPAPSSPTYSPSTPVPAPSPTPAATSSTSIATVNHQQYSLTAQLTNNSITAGTYTVPTDMISAQILTATFSGVTNTSSTTVDAFVTLVPASSPSTTPLQIVNANGKQGVFTTVNGIAGSTLPSWFVPGAVLNVVFTVVYPGWYLTSGTMVQIDLLYNSSNPAATPYVPSSAITPTPIAGGSVPSTPATGTGFVQTYTLGSTLTNNSTTVGTFVVPSNMITAQGLSTTWSGTTNTSSTTVDAFVTLVPASSPTTTPLQIVNANGKQGTFTVSNTILGSTLPSWFVPGAVLNVVFTVVYPGWYLTAGTSATISLAYS